MVKAIVWLGITSISSLVTLVVVGYRWQMTMTHTEWQWSVSYAIKLLLELILVILQPFVVKVELNQYCIIDSACLYRLRWEQELYVYTGQMLKEYSQTQSVSKYIFDV